MYILVGYQQAIIFLGHTYTSDRVQQSQAPYSPLHNIRPQTLVFSKDMSYKQLIVWLTNHPQFVGADYQQDISKLRGMCTDTVTVTVYN